MKIKVVSLVQELVIVGMILIYLEVTKKLYLNFQILIILKLITKVNNFTVNSKRLLIAK